MSESGDAHVAHVAHVAHGFVAHGRVQGVGFRHFACTVARDAGVSGWVANQPDGTVVGEVRGTADAVEAFLRAIRVGPGGARVVRVDLEEAVVGNIVDRGFVVR